MTRDSQPPGAGNPATPPAGVKGEDEGIVFTPEQQAEVDRRVREAATKAASDRVAKLKAEQDRAVKRAADEAQAAAVQSFREEHGLDDQALENIGTWRTQQQATAEEVAKLRLSHSSLTKELEAERQRVEKLVTERRAGLIGRELKDALIANGRVRPEAIGDVEQLLSARLDVGDDGQVLVKGEDGSALHGVTVGDFVADQLQARPHYLLPDVQGGGGGSRGGAPPAPSKPHDFSTRKGVAAAYAEVMAKPNPSK